MEVKPSEGGGHPRIGHQCRLHDTLSDYKMLDSADRPSANGRPQRKNAKKKAANAIAFERFIFFSNFFRCCKHGQSLKL